MLIEEITLNGLLSFGPDSPPLPLRPLNVLVGPNGSGKSNLVEAIGFLRSSPGNFARSFRGTGGVGEWFWKGRNNKDAILRVRIPRPAKISALQHAIHFTQRNERFEIESETIEAIPDGLLYLFENDIGEMKNAEGKSYTFGPDEFWTNESILSQIKDPIQYPALTFLAKQYEQVRIYREWSFGRSSVFRAPQPADLPSDRLEENLSNFGLFLNHLRGFPQAKKTILEHLGDLYDDLEDFDVRIKGGTVEVFLTEGDFTIPASRLSDGTLRYLCLLAILCDPEPPPLICIEEPELGLHPDILPKIADLLIEASERTQLIVTTHSDILVDAMTEEPESVVVVEKHDRQTRMERLRDEGALGEMLKKYRLGELWMSGEIGGTRW